MRIPRKLLACLFLLAAACGGDDKGVTPDLDHLVGDDPAIPRDLAVGDGGSPCVTNADCPGAGYVCAFPIADGCAAVGHCALVPTPTCASIVEMCGCSGNVVPGGGCFYESGYAGGPTTGGFAPSCGDGGTE